MVMVNCRHFNGYKPCGFSEVCSAQCSHVDIVETAVVIIHLGAIGAVVRSTSLLKSIHAKYPKAHLTWITDKPSDQLLRNHPLIDRVISSDTSELLQLQSQSFDIGLVIDKSAKAVGISNLLKIKNRFGFTANPINGAIVPQTAAAQELWSLGLDNHQKFFINTKSEAQLVLEALELGGPLGEYDLPLTSAEQALMLERKAQWTRTKNQPVIGINTGCSQVIAAKKLSVAKQRELIAELMVQDQYNIVLLGGPEDTERNHQIGDRLPVFQSPTELGLRDGLVSVAACDIVVTGDSLGMHMAISQKKYVVAWFGPTCAHEIELYGRGEKILAPVPCAPCWKRSCDKNPMCYDEVSIESLSQAIAKGLANWPQRKSSLFKLPFSEISF